VVAVSQQGGLTAIPAAALVAVQLGGGIAMSAALEGQLLVVDAPTGERGTYQIGHYDGTHVWITLKWTEKPAWFAAACTASVIESGAHNAGGVDLVGQGSFFGTTTKKYPGGVLNLRSYLACYCEGAVGAVFVVDVRSGAGVASFIMFNGMTDSQASARYINTSGAISPGVLEEYGYTIVGSTYATFGCRGTTLYVYGGGLNFTRGGYFTQDIWPNCAQFGATASFARSFRGYGGVFGVTNCFSKCGTDASYPPFYSGSCARVAIDVSSVVGVPAAGFAGGLAHATSDGSLTITGSDGVNDGTGATSLFGLQAIRGGTIETDGASYAAIYGKHGHQIKNGAIRITTAATVASRPGGGSDVYVEDGSFRMDDNFTKSAVNSETAIQNGADGQIVAVGTQFIAASAVFTSAHVGRSIKVSGAVNPANNAVHLITAYTNPTTVVLGASAGLVNEGPGLTWGLVGTPQPIIEVARGGRVSQASGKTFNVRHPEVDPDTAVQEWNNYGYGPNGAIYEHENAEVTLGTLVEAAGAANATGVAATLRNKSTLLHTGGAVILGVAPLKIGAGAAIAWPAAPVTDDTVAGAVISGEGNKIIPNV
jgi:hypothetical protein